MARECGIKPERLHMIDDTTGIEAKKADTSIEKELARMRIQAENASIAEKAQKESTVQTQEKRVSPPSPVNDEEGVIETANTRRQRKKRQNEAAVQAACEKARQAAHKHGRTSWAFCSDDDCTIHQSDKEKSGKFPHGKSNQGQEQEGILMMEPGEVPHWEKFRVIMQGKTVAVLSTRHWIDGPCTEACPRLGVPGCEGTHRRFSPHENPEARDEMVPITRCNDVGCEYHGPHTHDIIGEDKYDFPFEDEETDSDGEWEQVETTEDNKYEVLKTGVLYAVVRTNHWLEMKCQTPGGCDRIHRVVDPRGLEKPEKNVVLWRCPGCDKTTTPHTHDFLNHQDYHEFPFFDEQDWTKQQRTEEISMKYQPIKLYEAGLAIRTHYWTVHNNKTWYAPKGYVQQTFRTLLLPTCKRETCENYGPTHTHAILGVKTHFFTLADAEPDSEVELEESEPSEYEEEAEYVMMMQPEEDQEEEEEEETKFIVINFTKTTHEVITPYWRNVTCRLTSCPHNRQHAHRIYDPDTTPKIPKQVVIRLCQNRDCQYAPELHAHQGGDDDYTNVNLATAAAQMVYGKDHPTMEDLPKNEVEEDS
ncbi:hypothetical protein LTR20_008012 [Exophiala xenobiotica]|nr:hypothetical protein LTR79_003159 [Exophiala xenobiotica]KAK5458525.1 hypothetical protein LTR20_008012 [Exophiala xenobiotica]KAK5490925.1 hypothetical protein LTR26_003686 [Exophiala xenobiotica]